VPWTSRSTFSKRSARTAVLLAASSLAVSLLGRSALEKPHPAVARGGDRRPGRDRQHYAVRAMADKPDAPEPDKPPPPPPPIPNIGLPQTGGKPKTF
jgi:hypothetical protein